MHASQADQQGAPAGAPAVATERAHATYTWDLATDALHWSPDAASVFDIASLTALSSGRAFAARLVPESIRPRETAIFEGARDGGVGVAYQASYGLILDDEDRDAAIVWIDDRGHWFAGPDERPARAEGRIRLITLGTGATGRADRAAAPLDPLAGLLGREAFLAHIARKLAGLGRKPVPFALLIGRFPAGEPGSVAAAVETLRLHMRTRDVLAQCGADRLGLLLETCDPEQMQMAADRFLAALAGPATGGFRLGGTIAPRDGREITRLLEGAEKALDAACMGETRFQAYVRMSPLD